MVGDLTQRVAILRVWAAEPVIKPGAGL